MPQNPPYQISRWGFESPLCAEAPVYPSLGMFPLMLAVLNGNRIGGTIILMKDYLSIWGNIPARHLHFCRLVCHWQPRKRPLLRRRQRLGRLRPDDSGPWACITGVGRIAHDIPLWSLCSYTIRTPPPPKKKLILIIQAWSMGFRFSGLGLIGLHESTSADKESVRGALLGVWWFTRLLVPLEFRV